MKHIIKIKIYQHDFMPGFAAFKIGTTKKPHAEIAINIGSLMLLILKKKIKKREVPYFLAESIMHEIIHVLEEKFKVKFSHRKINLLMNKYQEYIRKIADKNEVQHD